ncbi:MAG: prepilin peptidase [Hungatella hathewayi]|uniref:prepilin peptidase n=1 Tax=Hungatella TaxID=1649459 RepID=UPI001FAE3C98|nr:MULTISPECIES: prepilin peptidase [Hungatella]MCI7380764.1 prepilin peptidase [Hungatella sp.]MDY6235758.1 prepilin peptidase [Hungatella hathewayi]
METVQTVSFVMLMAGASWWDIHKRIFPNYYVFLLILAAMISFNPWKLTGILAALPFLLTALWAGGVGGGDIKFVAASGLVLGFGRTCAAEILGICFLLLFHGAGTAVRAMQKKEPCQYYPMVPFLAAGNLILYFYGGSGK